MSQGSRQMFGSGHVIVMTWDVNLCQIFLKMFGHHLERMLHLRDVNIAAIIGLFTEKKSNMAV